MAHFSRTDDLCTGSGLIDGDQRKPVELFDAIFESPQEGQESRPPERKCRGRHNPRRRSPAFGLPRIPAPRPVPAINILARVLNILAQLAPFLRIHAAATGIAATHLAPRHRLLRPALRRQSLGLNLNQWRKSRIVRIGRGRKGDAGRDQNAGNECRKFHAGPLHGIKLQPHTSAVMQ